MAPTDDEISAQLQPDVPHAARIWNYWMGGKDNFAADRVAGDAVAQVYPEIVLMAQHSRRFLIRVVHYLAAEAGIRQFLDIGTGLPTMQNTHEVAQAVAPGSRIVYVDNDRYLSGSMHTWLGFLKGAARGTRGRVRTGQHW